MRIFIQIASYRDPELIPTIKDCLKKAQYPENLTFGICRQYHNEDKFDNIDEYRHDSRFTIMDVPWNESKGTCWARHQCQKMWKNEEYMLQLDSHHRFINNWDKELFDMLKLTGSSKPILTGYVAPYSPSENTLTDPGPYKIVASNYPQEGGNINFIPAHIENWKSLKKPIKARFISGHFIFTYGTFCDECKYDPNLYFSGEEISLSLRAYTMGYDLFHPHKTIIWHEYTRQFRVKHWDDFEFKNKEKGNIDKLWHELDDSSKRRLRYLLREEDSNMDFGEYGLGNIRTHEDYEKYAGVNFKLKKLHPEAIKGIEPPSSVFNWLEDETEYTYTINIPKTDDFYFIFIGFEDVNTNILFRKDLFNYQETLVVNFKSYSKPFKWVYWVHNKDNTWGNRIDTIL